MRNATSPDIHTSWNHPSYETRVRGTIFLWGSDALTLDFQFDKPLLLHVRNDVFGEDITLGTQMASGAKTTIGMLKPGQCISIPLQKISGVFATCALQSQVGCVIKS